jgi:ribonuclease G
MLKEIIVSKDEYETRAALLEDKMLAELFIERQGERYILGNIYKGRVNSILPGMQAAFVDIGLARNAFLHVSDVAHHLEEYEEFIDGSVGDSESSTRDQASGQDGYRKRNEALSIRDLLRKGQEILVQVDKEPMDTKGPRVTAYITLPGRYLVYMPTVEHIGISRRIENESERQRLKGIVERLRDAAAERSGDAAGHRVSSKGGFIVRTAAEGKGEEEFLSDMKFLADHWQRINRGAQRSSAPALIHEDLGLTFRVIRDVFTQDVTRFVIDSKEEYDRILNEFCPTTGDASHVTGGKKKRDGKGDSPLPSSPSFSSSLRPKLKLYNRDEPIFEAFSIEKQIKKALRQKIWLKSGGHIVINPTEALVAIDVNTGKYVGRENAEETILKTNMEAASEIARQIRLRDVGGIIIIDFIDMDKEEHKNKVLRTLQDVLKRDRSRTNILQITDLGLVEMTRQRTKPSLSKTLCQPCPYCQGDGVVTSTETTSITILRDIKKIYRRHREKQLKVMASGPVAFRLLEDDNDEIKKLENQLGIEIEIEEDLDLHIEDFRIISKKDQRELSLEEED